jgi:predicted naringenin-chalcone synthase
VTDTAAIVPNRPAPVLVQEVETKRVIAGVQGVLPPHRYTQSEVTEAVLEFPGYENFGELVRHETVGAAARSRTSVLMPC